VPERVTTEPEISPQEQLADNEPRYLRRQKPVEVRKRKFGQQQRARYLRMLMWTTVALAAGLLIYVVADFALNAEQFRLASLDSIEVSGNQRVAREAVIGKFAADEGRSVLRIPLAARRRALEEIPWVQHARVERLLPNRIRVAIVERTPVAFLRQGAELALIDADGVVLERPLQADYQFPVVTGLGDAASREERASRMKLFQQFLNDVEAARPGSAAYVIEVDLEDAKDLRASLAGLPELDRAAADGQGPVLVHFGPGDFQSKFAIFVENIGEWRAKVGRVESVDLRFDRQVVVNSEPLVPVPQDAANRELTRN
jgi:cell division protein FtsQ